MEQCVQDLKEKYTFDELANKCFSYMQMFEAEQFVSLSKRAEIEEKNCKIEEMQSHIDCLKAELAEVQQNKPEPPAEPIKVADWLIDRHMEHAGEFERHFAAENAGKIVAGSPVEKFRQAQVAKIRQIAEHLVTYCNHVEEE